MYVPFVFIDKLSEARLVTELHLVKTRSDFLTCFCLIG